MTLPRAILSACGRATVAIASINLQNVLITLSAKHGLMNVLAYCQSGRLDAVIRVNECRSLREIWKGNYASTLAGLSRLPTFSTAALSRPVETPNVATSELRWLLQPGSE